jgi:hypothetical protein
MKLLRLIKIFLNETHNKVLIGKNLSDNFPIQNGLKQGFVSSPLLFISALEYAIRKVEQNKEGLKLNGTLQLVANVGDVSLLGNSIRTIKLKTQQLMQ